MARLRAAVRAGRLAQLSEMQARYDAEQGDFELMRYWQEKTKRLKVAAEKLRQRLVAAVRAREARQKAAQRAEAAGAAGGPRRAVCAWSALASLTSRNGLDIS